MYGGIRRRERIGAKKAICQRGHSFGGREGGEEWVATFSSDFEASGGRRGLNRYEGSASPLRREQYQPLKKIFLKDFKNV